ncbi:MAG: hypothetical protein IPH04_03705 [Saprospirales bacterium]|nr:hypothetical protein [Saprospirales bacterium]
MRPIRFLFMLSLGFLLFFFAGRFLLFAFVAFVLFGLVFKAGRRILYHRQRRQHNPVWKNDLLLEYPDGLGIKEERRAHRIIVVE